MAVVVARSSIFFFNDTATTEIYTLSLPTLFRSVEAPAAKAGGLQLTVVTVGCLVTVTAAAVALEELSWVASPSYVATMVWGPTVVELWLAEHDFVLQAPCSDVLGHALVEASGKKLTVAVAKGGVATESFFF